MKIKRIHKRPSYTAAQPLVVACSLDFDRDEYLVQQAARLAHQLEKSLHLVHSLEPFRYQHWIAANSQDNDGDETDQSAPNGNIFRTALAGLNQLADLARSQLSNIDITANVLTGAPADSIAQEAINVNAQLIIVGAVDESRILASLSTTRSLLTASTVPVLIINDDCTSDFSKDLNILIADSLYEQALQPLEAAVGLLSKSGLTRLIHAHVVKDNFKFFHRKIDLLSVKGSNKFLDEINARAEMVGLKSSSRPKSYVPIVVEGSPNEKLHELADQFSADIVIFGKHKLFHGHDFTLGSVSTSGMLSHKSAVMVVPA